MMTASTLVPGRLRLSASAAISPMRNSMTIEEVTQTAVLRSETQKIGSLIMRA